jgi:hypothetical protein
MRRLASKDSSVASATSVERPRWIALCRYTPCIRQCVGRSRLSACAQVLSPPFSPILLCFALHSQGERAERASGLFAMTAPISFGSETRGRLPLCHRVTNEGPPGGVPSGLTLDPPQVGYARTVSQLDLVHHVDHQHQRPLENTGAV